MGRSFHLEGPGGVVAGHGGAGAPQAGAGSIRALGPGHGANASLALGKNSAGWELYLPLVSA
jgi:hypothetical protein